MPAGVEGGEEEREDEELLPECTALPCFCTLIYLAFRLWRCFSFFLASQLEVHILQDPQSASASFPGLSILAEGWPGGRKGSGSSSLQLTNPFSVCCMALVLHGTMGEVRVMVAGTGQWGEERGVVAPDRVLLPLAILCTLYSYFFLTSLLAPCRREGRDTHLCN